MQKISTINRHTLLFPLALVLYEFTVYMCNDMIQPGMSDVVREMNASRAWIPTSMTAFLLGGALFSWLFGPLSDRLGRRPIMLTGAAYFIFTCLAILFVKDIHSFIFFRFLQGVALCFIASVGYAVVHEAFTEIVAIKMTALMTNVALIAPLLGPVLGAITIQHSSWHATFIIIAVFATIAWWGLYKKMPETISREQGKTPFRHIFSDYREIFSNSHFLKGAITLPLLSTPLISWIALSPLVLIRDSGMSMVEYGFWQIPIFASLMAGNFFLAYKADRWPLGKTVKLSLYPIALGGGGMLVGSYWPHQSYSLIAGISLMSFGEGISYAVLMRFTLTESLVAKKGTVASAIGMVAMMIYVITIELYSLFYLSMGIPSFAILSVLATCAYMYLSRSVVDRGIEARTIPPEVKQDEPI